MIKKLIALLLVFPILLSNVDAGVSNGNSSSIPGVQYKGIGGFSRLGVSVAVYRNPVNRRRREEDEYYFIFAARQS